MNQTNSVSLHLVFRFGRNSLPYSPTAPPPLLSCGLVEDRWDERKREKGGRKEGKINESRNDYNFVGSHTITDRLPPRCGLSINVELMKIEEFRIHKIKDVNTTQKMEWNLNPVWRWTEPLRRGSVLPGPSVGGSGVLPAKTLREGQASIPSTETLSCRRKERSHVITVVPDRLALSRGISP